MKNVLIIDMQPVCRVGLKALLKCKYDNWVFHEARVIEDYILADKRASPAIIILGMDFELANPDIEQIGRIRKLYPAAAIVILGGTVEHWKILSLFVKGINGYVSKQEHEKEILECLQCVQSNRKYLSSANINILLDNMEPLPLVTHTEESLTVRELKIATYLSNGISTSTIAEMLNRKPSTISSTKE